LTLLRHTGPVLTGEESGQLAALGVTVVEGVVEEIEASADRLAGARLAGGRRVSLDAVAVAPRFLARAELLAPLGLRPVEIRAGEYVVGTRIQADAAGLLCSAVPMLADLLALRRVPARFLASS
jgi:hypothetical protein